MKTSKWIGFSLGLHAVILFATIMFASKLQPRQNVVVELVVQEPTQIPIPKNIVKSSGHSHNKSNIAKSSHNDMGIGKRSNLFGHDYNFDSALQNESGIGSRRKDFRDRDNYLFDSGNMLADTDEWEFFRHVYEKIDSQLMFDSILAQYNHFGTVMVEFEVNSQGLIVEKKVRIAAEDPILKVHVMRAIRRG